MHLISTTNATICGFISNVQQDVKHTVATRRQWFTACGHICCLKQQTEASFTLNIVKTMQFLDPYQKWLYKHKGSARGKGWV